MSARRKPADPQFLLFGPDPTGGIQAARDWLDHQIAAAGLDLTTHRYEVTPCLADAILERNKDNRTPKEGVIFDHMARLKEGRWILHSQGISFSPDGILNNGQHRCFAISRSGIAAWMNIAFGEPREAFAVLDTQTRRGAGATLEVMGEVNGAMLGAALRCIRNIDRGGRGNYQIDNEELGPLLAQHPRLRESCSPGGRAGKRLRCSVSGAAVAHYLIMTRSSKAGLLEKFWESLVTGTGATHPRDPIIILRDSVQRRLVYEKRIPQAHIVAACIINAWNSWSRDKKAVSVKWPNGTPFPEVL